MERTITIIPATIDPITLNPLGVTKKRRTAAYARVSTKQEEQLSSYDAQVEHYTSYIQNNPKWEFVKIYADEGKSGTNTKYRHDFNEMIEDARNGKIDLILTKSISRFARNTLDTISLTRELRDMGVEIFFEEIGLSSIDPKSEFILSIMASIAQEESRSISSHVTTGIRWGFERGIVRINHTYFLGYKTDPKTKQLVIIEDEAEVVRKIYKMFLKEGKSCFSIANYLKENNVLTPSGKSVKWTSNNIISILTNEKYKGDAILQKTYTNSYLDHKKMINNGKYPQFFIENSHPAIIDRDYWEQVQIEMERRRNIGSQYSTNDQFVTKLKCEDCGGYYGPKVWHSNDKYTRRIYQCNHKYDKNKKKCETPTLDEKIIKDKFVSAYNALMVDKDRIINDTEEVINLLCNIEKEKEDIDFLTSEVEVINEMIKKLINDATKETEEEFNTKYKKYCEKFDETKMRLDETQARMKSKQNQGRRLNAIVSQMKEHESVLVEWDKEIWITMLEEAIIHRDESISFKFYNGTTIQVN